MRLIPWRYRLIIGYTAVVVCLLFVGGCATESRSLVEQQHREAMGLRSAAEYTTSARPDPMPAVELTTSKNGDQVLKVTPPAETASTAKAEQFEDYASNATGAATKTVTLPTGTKLILLAVGVLLLLLVAWLIRRSSKAADAAWQWTDDALGAQINSVRDKLAEATDPARITVLRGIEAELLRKQMEAVRP